MPVDGRQKGDYMTRIMMLLALCTVAIVAPAQRLLNLDSCRALALRNNKKLSISHVEQDMAKNIRKSARTKYLPQVNALGSYTYTSKEISILDDDQKAVLRNLGGGLPAPLSTVMGQLGNHVADAFRTDTRNVFVGTVGITQPVFMGGSIVAMNKMATLNEEMAANTNDAKRQQTIYDTDKAYWTVVSLTHKKKLAESFLKLVSHLDDDVDKMIREGVATRADGLTVKVKENEAEMTLSQVNDGLVLARMLLCQMCGLPLSDTLILAEEQADIITEEVTMDAADAQSAIANRPEIRALQNAVDMSKQTVNVMKAGHLPKVMLTGGYMFSNPNVFNGYRNKFDGVWNVGVVVQLPIWNWGDVAYKVRAAKGMSTIAALEKADAEELIELQIKQSEFKLAEANKRLMLSRKSVERAEENLRCANIGFKEGVMTSTTVMEAQTAWLQARSQQIDAEINLRLAQVDFKKSVGTLEQ